MPDLIDRTPAQLKCIHGYEYPREGPCGPWECNPDGSNPNCPNCSPDAWHVPALELPAPRKDD